MRDLLGRLVNIVVAPGPDAVDQPVDDGPGMKKLRQ
jgi:hypothetical protein